MSINVSFILEQFEDYSDGNSIKCSTETFREILNQKSNLKNKRTKCSYFVWLDENRSRIKDELRCITCLISSSSIACL